MPSYIDFHFHSLYSDGTIMPEECVDAAVASQPQVSHMGLSDHDTYNGCESFLKACDKHGIEGFVSCEVGGTHPDFPHFEMHLISMLGNAWTPEIKARADLFHPYWNKLRQNDINNLFLFLELAAKQGLPLSYRDVTRKSIEKVLARDELKEPGLIQPVKFAHVRDLLEENGIKNTTAEGKDLFVKQVWEKAGVRPAYTPPYSEAYDAFAKAKPAVVIAHPMIYPWSIEEARKVIEEFKSEIGLAALEAHYGGKLYPEWKQLAEETGLLVSAGSDCHGVFGKTSEVPVVTDEDLDLEKLLECYREAGER